MQKTKELLSALFYYDKTSVKSLCLLSVVHDISKFFIQFWSFVLTLLEISVISG